MVDDTSYSDTGAVALDAVPTGAAPAAGGGPRPLLLIVGAVVGLLAVAGIVAAAVFFFVLNGADEPAVQDPAVVTPIPPQTDEEAPVEPPQVSLRRVFTFRDVFSPLIQPLPEPVETDAPTLGPDGQPIAPSPTDPSDPTDPGDPGVTLPPNTLFLRDVVSADGVPAAVLHLDGQTHTLVEGAEIPGTPWRVLSIRGSSVVMLYGDVQVTLSVGQGVVSSAK